MSRKPMFIPNPDGSEGYLLSLAGVLLISGNAVFGDPAETTPTGRANAMRMIERILQEAEKRGFKHTSTVWSLMRPNETNPRLANLAQEATDLIPKDIHIQIFQEEVGRAKSGDAGVPALVAQKYPGQHEPETNPRFTRPGPNGIDPRFIEAGRVLKEIREREGPGAMQNPKHAHLVSQMHKFAPESFKSEMTALAKKMDLMPKATHVGSDGQVVYTTQQIADKYGVSVEEIEGFMARADIGPDDLYSGPLFPIQ